MTHLRALWDTACRGLPKRLLKRGCSLFNTHYVRSGLVSKEMATVYNDLFERRQESDYEDFFTFEETEVTPWMGQATEFVEAICSLVGTMEKS